MIVVMSERKFAERIRELEGINDSVEEICDRIHHHANRLFQHISQNHGVTMTGMLSQGGTMGTFQFQLAPVYSDQDRADRIAGLSMMNPNSISVEYGDLPGLFRDIALVGMQDSWNSYGRELQKLSVAELEPTLERVATRVLFGAPPPDLVALHQLGEGEAAFQMFLQRAGRKDPLAQWQARDEAEQRELAAVEAAREAEYNKFRNGE